MSAASRRATAQSMRGRRAGVVSRFLAAGIDFFVVIAILLAILMFFSLIRYLLGEGPAKLPKTSAFRTGVEWPFVEFTYLALAWSLTGRTVGKHFVGLRVVNRDGTRLGGTRSCGRAALCTLFGVPSLMWAAVSSRNYAVHDIVVKTAVVHDWPDAHKPLATRHVTSQEDLGVAVPSNDTVQRSAGTSTP